MYLLETLIDTKLSDDGHSDDEVGNFYDNFKDNYKQYKDENPDTVQILLEFLDFQKFKASILKYKEGVVDEPEDNPDNEMDMATFDSAFFMELMKEDVNDESLGWKLRSQHKDDGKGL